MPNHSFVLNGKKVSVDIENNVRMLWVLRDVLGVTGPKYGCGIRVCQACTSHLNGKHLGLLHDQVTGHVRRPDVSV